MSCFAVILLKRFFMEGKLAWFDRASVSGGFRKLLGLLWVFAFVCAMQPAEAKEYKASLAEMPVYAESVDRGVLVDLVKLISEVSGTPIAIQVVPFARSVSDVSLRNVDFHMPLIQRANQDSTAMGYDYSTVTLFHVNFVLYSNKRNPLQLSTLDGLEIETDLAHVQCFDFPVSGSSSIEGSLRKVNAGRIDGFIFADFASDPLVKKDNLVNIKRQLYQVFDVKAVLPKGGKGKEVDLFLTETVTKLRESGRYGELMAPLDQAYCDWQP